MTTLNRLVLTGISLSLSLPFATELGAGEVAALEQIPEAIPVQPSTQPFSAELSAGYDSDYIFRGLDMGDNLVWTGLGVAIPVCDAVQFSVGAWYGTLTDTNFSELDLSAGLVYDLGPATLGVNYTYYHFARGMLNPRATANTSDINTTLVSSLGPVDVALLYSYNTRNHGHYVELGASTQFKLCDRVALVPAASIGYDAGYHPTATDGFSSVNISLSAPIKLTENAILTPYIATSLTLDSLEGTNSSDDIFYGGVNLAVGF